MKNLHDMRKDAAEIFTSGISAVEAGAAIRKSVHLEGRYLKVANRSYDLTRFENIDIIGAGKATAPMAAAMEDLLKDQIPSGIINVKYHHTEKLKYVEIVEAGHPLPDENGLSGANRIFNTAASAGPEDLVICLISGGGSALLPLPAKGISLLDKQITIQALLNCGATIHEINALRKHLSLIKGGQLARAAHPATLITLILSDVVGDNLDVIASGPTVPDLSTYSDCMDIINKYELSPKLPPSVIVHIKKGLSNNIPETPKEGESFFDHTQNMIIGNNTQAILAAKKTAEQLGYNTFILSSLIEGDTTQAAKFHSAIAREILKTGNPLSPPACLLSGGETTVNVRGNGTGGRNMEFALASALEIAGHGNIVVLSGGTDGTDGPTEAAGAISDDLTLKRAIDAGLDAAKSLTDNDSYPFFNAMDDLLITGPTRTNVMDIRVVLVC